MLMPMMGGRGTERIIPLIHKYFQQNPSEIQSDFLITGFGSISNFSILDAKNYYKYISSPFYLIIDNADEKKIEASKHPAAQLEFLLKNELDQIKEVATTVKSDEKNQLTQLNGFKIRHYALSRGVVARMQQESDNKSNPQYDKIISNWTPSPDEGDWGFGIEGFIEDCSNTSITLEDNKDSQLKKHCFKGDHETIIRNLLEKAKVKNNLPKYIELGSFTLSLGGESYYLDFDEDGLVKNHENNKNRLLTGGEDNITTPNPSLRIKEIIETEARIRQLIEETEVENRDKLEQLEKLRERIVKIPETIKGKISRNEELTIDDMGEILEMERKAQKEIQEKIESISTEYDIPTTLNPKFGHISNHGVDNSGLCRVTFKDGSLIRELEERYQHRQKQQEEMESTNPSSSRQERPNH